MTEDLLTLAGLVLLGIALWWGAGWPGLIGYAGGLLLAVGVLLAWRKTSRAG